jgi:hypothetical protein
MKKLKLSETGSRGWFVGNFDGAVERTEDFEVCFQTNLAGTKSIPHYHLKITELQLITRGKMVINNVEFGPGDICRLEPGEPYYASYLEDTDVVAVKWPSLPDDKYYI